MSAYALSSISDTSLIIISSFYLEVHRNVVLAAKACSEMLERFSTIRLMFQREMHGFRVQQSDERRSQFAGQVAIDVRVLVAQEE